MVRSKLALLSASTILSAAGLFAACGGDEPSATTDVVAPGAAAAADGATPTPGDATASTDGGAAPSATRTPPGTASAADARIASAVLMRLVADREVDARAFDVRVQAGIVTLSPDDGTPVEIVERASIIARESEGVVSVNVEGVGAPTQALPQDAAAVQELVAQNVGNSPFDPEGDGSVEAAVDAPAAIATPEPPAEENPVEPAEQAQPEEAAEAPSAEPELRPYTVRRGESLSVIASRQLGDGSRWNEIYRLNRDVIGPNPDGVREGMTIQLPPRR